jgi:O-antigen/teichoic acid export membrane protein
VTHKDRRVVGLEAVPATSKNPPCIERRIPASNSSRDQRTRRLMSAWLTLVPSKAVFLIVQIIAIPMVYRSIGPEQFAAYAAVTAAVSILGFLNLGMGGALVTPLAEAAASGDHQREARLFGATLIPIAAIATLALCIILPGLWFLPLRTLFGLAATTTAPQALRAGALLACIGTIAAIPLSVIDSARQAYQEMHISNLFGLLTNTLLCAGLVLAAWLRPTLPAFVAVTALSPLATRLVNAALLFLRRPYLLPTRRGGGSWLLVRRLAGDGFSYMGAAAIANVLLYQWPVYYMARVRPPLESSTFALYFQIVLLVLSFGVSIAQPLWPAVADAAGRGDWVWIAKVLSRARAAALVGGVCELFALGFLMNLILRLWLHRPIHIEPVACWVAGAYLLLATWEYVHWPLALGLGAMRAASSLVFWRAVAFAVSVPLVISHGTVGLMVALCTSIIAISAWLYPVLLARTFAARMGERGSSEMIRVVIGSSGPAAPQF